MTDSERSTLALYGSEAALVRSIVISLVTGDSIEVVDRRGRPVGKITHEDTNVLAAARAGWNISGLPDYSKAECYVVYCGLCRWRKVWRSNFNRWVPTTSLRYHQEGSSTCRPGQVHRWVIALSEPDRDALLRTFPDWRTRSWVYDRDMFLAELDRARRLADT